MIDEPYRVSTRSKWITLFGCLIGLGIVFIVSGVFAVDKGFQVGFLCIGGLLCLGCVIGCTWACRTSRYDIDDLPIRIQEDMGLV